MDARTILIGGQARELSPLSFGGHKRCKEVFRNMFEGLFADADEFFDGMTTVILESVRRTAPEVTREELQDALDFVVAREAVAHIVSVSYPRPEAGETKAASPSGESTGTS